jgi:cephalosporin hydroxylase
MNLTIIDQGAGHFEFISKFDNKPYSASQRTEIASRFEQFLINEKFDIVIEIGTFKGGTTIVLDDIRKHNDLKFKLYTYDISLVADMDSDSLKQSFKDRDIAYIIGDIFSEDIIAEITNFIGQNNKVCILCDGGNKINEFNYFSKLIKSNDFIMAHDYSENQKKFENEVYMKVWNWFEISDSDIEESCNKHDLVSYNKENFDQVAWVCKKK